MKKSVLNPTIEEPKEVYKKVKIQDTGRQLTVPIPSLFIETLNLRKGDIFIFYASLYKKGEYSIKIKKHGRKKN